VTFLIQSNDLQNTTQKTNDQALWTPQKLGLSSDALEGEEEFEDTKEVIRKFKSKERQYIHLISLKTACKYCLSFDLKILITPLVSSNSSYLYRASELNPFFVGFMVVYC
jgi:hypothetical protein